MAKVASKQKRISDIALMLEQGMDPAPSTPEAFGDYIKFEIAKWAKVIKEMGLKGN